MAERGSPSVRWLRRVVFPLLLLSCSPIITRLFAQERVRVVELTASSKLLEEGSHPEGYNAFKAFDGRSDSAWCEGKPDAGIGEEIRLGFAVPVTIDAIDFQPGLFNPQWYKANNRVKKLLIGLDDGRKSFTFTFTDTMTAQRKSLENVRTKRIVFKILEVYPGDRFDDTNISEISLIRDRTPLRLWLPTPETEEKDGRLLDQLKEAIQRENDDLAKQLIPQIQNLDIDQTIMMRKWEKEGPWEFSPPYIASALERAIETNGIDVVKMLLDAGASPGRAVDFAVMQNRTGIIRLLIDAGAIPSLFSAVKADNGDVAELALKAGRDPNEWLELQSASMGTFWITPLNFARSTEMVGLLIRYGARADSEKKGQGGNFYAIAGPVVNLEADVVKEMLAAGADATQGMEWLCPDQFDHGYMSIDGRPSGKATYLQMVELLLEAGAKSDDTTMESFQNSSVPDKEKIVALLKAAARRY